MGSTSDESLNLTKDLRRLEDLFWVSKEELQTISKRFQEELEEGLEADGKNISMNVTWIQGWPRGLEKGSYLTVDLGGTNIRVCWITLPGEHGETKVEQQKYKLPDKIKKGDKDTLWSYLAESVERFIDDQKLEATEQDPLPLGFTFSYPVIQERLDHGILQTWTKGFDIKGVEGEDVAEQFCAAMKKRKIPVRLVALVNDTVGAMIASSYKDDQTISGAVFGTGCNAAYMEECGSIPKISSEGHPADALMAINCEYGAFDNSHRVLPRTKYDEMIDIQSPRPGQQTFEKMSAGLYLGEIFRLVMLDLHDSRTLFQSHNQDISKLRDPYTLDTAFLSAIENDTSSDLQDTKDLFEQHLNTSPTADERIFLQRLAQTIAVRGARLCACGIAAICRKKGIGKGHVAADGSVANKHPHFKKRWAQALGEILGWEEGRQGEGETERSEDAISLTSAEDGSGVGAAVIVAMALERGWV